MKKSTYKRRCEIKAELVKARVKKIKASIDDDLRDLIGGDSYTNVPLIVEYLADYETEELTNTIIPLIMSGKFDKAVYQRMGDPKFTVPMSLGRILLDKKIDEDLIIQIEDRGKRAALRILPELLQNVRMSAKKKRELIEEFEDLLGFLG